MVLNLIFAAIAYTGFKLATDAPFVAYILENRLRSVEITEFFGTAPKLEEVLKEISASYFECRHYLQDRYLCTRRDFGVFERGYFVMVFADDAGRVVRVEAHTEVDAL